MVVGAPVARPRVCSRRGSPHAAHPPQATLAEYEKKAASDAHRGSVKALWSLWTELWTTVG
jgi:hypothetical protein